MPDEDKSIAQRNADYCIRAAFEYYADEANFEYYAITDEQRAEFVAHVAHTIGYPIVYNHDCIRLIVAYSEQRQPKG